MKRSRALIPPSGQDAAFSFSAGFDPELIRASTLRVKQYVHPWFTATNFNREISDCLDDPTVLRLAIELPPRHGKSELSTRTFPSVFLGRNPDREVILTSYGADKAVGFSYDNMQLIDEPRFRQLFDLQLAPDYANKSHWKIKKRKGGLLATGIGGPIVGEGADLFVIDDPVKNREEAYSKTYREKLFEWWSTVVQRSLAGMDAKIIIIMQRWHHEDLLGKILQQEKRDGTTGKYKFKVLKFPAIDMTDANDKTNFSQGRALWPEKFALDYLVHLRKKMGPTNFGALYQQSPREESDYTIKRDWAQIVPGPAPADAVMVRCYDLAFKTKEKNDFTATVKISWSASQGEVIEHFEQWKEPIPQTMDRIKTRGVEEGPNVRIGILAGGTQVGYVQMLQNDTKLFGHIIEGLPEINDKIVNAVPWITRMKDGMVRLRAGKWNTEYMDLLEAFGPNCDHDDAPDATSGANSMLAQYIDYSVTPNQQPG